MEVEMNSSTAQFHHHQEMTSQTLESMLCNNSNNINNKAAADKKPRPPDQSALNCPRCDSTNTKFCYYNNYSLTQPRYFCKSCRRYWTKGGTLRNVPVGGGCRKSTKRPSSSSSTSNSPTSSSSSKRVPSSSSSHDLIHHQAFITNPILSHLPNYHHDGSSTTTDLSLAFARLQSQANGGFDFDHEHFLGGNSQNTPNGGSHDHFLGGGGGGHHSFLDALRGGFLENGNPNGLFHNMYSSYGDQNQMGNAENGGILGLSNVSNDHQLGMNGPLYHNEDHHQNQMASSGAATTAMTVTTVKQESCNGREVGGGAGGERSESRVLWGFPWQIGGSDHQAGNVVHEVDSGRSQIGGANWNGFGSTNWHGLLNSPLM